MQECWLSPYGQVIYTGCKWGHADKAASIIFEMYNDGKFESTQDVWCNDEGKSPTEQLEELGWIRYSGITNEWVIDSCTKLTTDQKNKMFDLTGWCKLY